MAERGTVKPKRSEPQKTAPSLKHAEKADAAALLAAENARLEAELAAARARIAELEQKQAEVVNRIDWVIDSLQSLAK